MPPLLATLWLWLACVATPHAYTSTFRDIALCSWAGLPSAPAHLCPPLSQHVVLNDPPWPPSTGTGAFERGEGTQQGRAPGPAASVQGGTGGIGSWGGGAQGG